ncbi:hypothetical protein V6N13_060241 [Hibiscus sabdariffa]
MKRSRRACAEPRCQVKFGPENPISRKPKSKRKFLKSVLELVELAHLILSSAESVALKSPNNNHGWWMLDARRRSGSNEEVTLAMFIRQDAWWKLVIVHDLLYGFVMTMAKQDIWINIFGYGHSSMVSRFKGMEVNKVRGAE